MSKPISEKRSLGIQLKDPGEGTKETLEMYCEFLKAPYAKTAGDRLSDLSLQSPEKDERKKEKVNENIS